MRNSLRSRLVRALGAVVVAAAVGGCAGADVPSATATTRVTVESPPGKVDVYAADRPGMLSPEAAMARSLVYVPNSKSDTVDVIDPSTFKIVDHFPVGQLPQHVVPAWDLRTLYVANDMGNSLTPIDPRTGKAGAPIAVEDPYNLYFTPDGSSAMVVAERLARIDFRDPHTFALKTSLTVPCKGVDHLDFSADEHSLLASCEFSGTVVRIRLDGPGAPAVDGDPLLLKKGGMPQDVKLSPDGSVYYVADMASNGVWVVDANKFRVERFIDTGKGAHGLYMSRDSKSMYVSNRGEGSVSVIDMATGTVRARWELPGGGSPDMGGVSADGTTLWLSGRQNGEVYAIDTSNGHLRARIAVGAGPHGLCVWPQPGRYSLGHTGILR
ncbi:MAG: hypothetical protein QOJ00_2363 [Actinomycetota bacterium]|jgi:YVTN family beta-propeller protein